VSAKVQIYDGQLGRLGHHDGATHLAEDSFGDAGSLEELDGSVAGDNVGAALVAFAEQLAKELSFVRGVVEFWMGS
jgi:hypothetical protein